MIISNRLMTAAFRALQSQLADDAQAAAKSGSNAEAYTQYHAAIHNICAQLACHGEDLSVSSAIVLLPGEKA